MTTGVNERLLEIRKRIAAACDRSGRSREGVNVIAVTKYVSEQVAEEAVQAGVIHIGENRWPDASDKWERLNGRASFHFIGSLQSRKAKEVVGKFAYIHSLDRLSLAEAIQRRAEELDVEVACFVQVNISGESTKHGVKPEEAESFVKDLAAFSRIRLIGLMTMAPHEEEPELTRPVFRGLRELLQTLNEKVPALRERPMTELSMGMSNDFDIAVEEGATWIRLGTVLVGP